MSLAALSRSVPMGLLVLMGSDSILSAQYPGGRQQLVRELAGRAEGEGFGRTLVSLGDLDGDAIADYAVGAPWSAVGPDLRGRVEIRSGSDHRVLREHGGEPGDLGFGTSLAALGDQDADGVPDYAIGAPQATVDQLEACGRVHLYSGASGERLRSWTGPSAFSGFGQALASAGDLDADGRAELAIGAPFADGAAAQSGLVRLHSSHDGGWLRDLEGMQDGDAFGYSLAALGDADADGFPDLLVGTPVGATDAEVGGYVHLYSGREGRLLLELADSGSPGFGALLAPAGDLDRDGRPDFLVGAPDASRDGLRSCGVLRAHSGADGSLLFELRGERSQERFPTAAHGVEDLDGDRTPDLIVAASSASDHERFERGVVRVHSGADGARLDRVIGETDDRNLGVALLWHVRPQEHGGPQLLAGAGEGVSIFEHAPLLVPTASSLSASRGGHLVYHLDFGAEAAALPYSLLLSESIGRTEWLGLLVPLERDRWLLSSAHGRYPLYCLDWNGLLDDQGRAWPILEASAGSVPAQAVGRTFYVSAVVALRTERARASAPVPLTLEP